MKKRRQPKNAPQSRSERAAPPKLPPFYEQVDLCTLSAYGVSGEEAWQAITTSREAHRRLISKCALGSDKPSTVTPLELVIFCWIEDSPDPIKELSKLRSKPFWRKLINEDVAGFIRRLHDGVAQLEWLIFSCIKHSSDPAQELTKVLSEPFWEKRINKDPAGFIRRLHEFMESKKTESFDGIDSALVIGWTHCALKRLPPFCLVTDRLLRILFNRSEAVIRQRIARLELYRPRRPRISGRELYGVGETFIKIKEVRKAPPLAAAEFTRFARHWLKQYVPCTKDVP